MKVNMLTDEVQSLSSQVKQLQEDKLSQEGLYTEVQHEIIKKEREKSANVYASEKLFRRRTINAIIISIVVIVPLWQIVDFFILKNPDNLFWRIVILAVENTPMAEQKTDYYAGWGGLISLSGICPLVYYLSKIFYSDEVIEKYKERKRRKFLKKAEKQEHIE